MKKTKNTRIKAAICCTAMIIFTLPTLTLASFQDVPSTHPYYDAINSLEEKGIIKGYGDNTYRPEQKVTRAEFIKMAFANIGYTPSSTPSASFFPDVQIDSWFAPYVIAGYELGAFSTNPRSPGFFPEAPISRIEALKMLMKISDIPTPYVSKRDLTTYQDVTAKTSYRYIVEAAAEAGLIDPFSGNKYFQAFAPISRAEGADLINRAAMYRDQVLEMPGMVFTGFSESDAELLNNDKFPIFLDVWSLINSNYMDHSAINQNELLYGAVQGMVDKLNDPYSTFESPTTAPAMEDALSGKFQGIGVILEFAAERIMITEVLPGSPAQKSGLQDGDIITGIDGQQFTADTSVQDAVSLIKGAAGTSLTLAIERNGAKQEVKIVREKIEYSAVNTSSNYVKIPSDISYIAISHFTDSAGKDFSAALKTAMTRAPKALIIDLRNNPGGYLDGAYEILNHFIEKGLTIAQIKYAAITETQKSEGSEELFDRKIPVYVLINENSASAAEVVAGALQDYGIATLVGTRSFGKGTVQNIFKYEDGSLVKLSTARWLTPLGKEINTIGLTPDIEVPITEQDVKDKNDAQLKKVLQTIESR